MPRASYPLTEAAWVAEIRAEIGRRPVVMQLAHQVTTWEQWSDEAWERGELDWAATNQERAALGAHRLGLLEETLLDIALGRSTGGEEMDFAI